MSHRKEMKKLCRSLKKRGWTIGQTRNQHVKLIAPWGETIFAASSPSDYRSIKNLRALIRRKRRNHHGR